MGGDPPLDSRREADGDREAMPVAGYRGGEGAEGAGNRMTQAEPRRRNKPWALTKANVSRLLRKHYEQPAKWITSRRVRGWGHWQQGFEIKEGRAPDELAVKFVFDSIRDQAPEYIARRLDAYALYLSAEFLAVREGERVWVKALPDDPTRLRALEHRHPQEDEGT
jgi:hypothetical protein